MARYCDPLIRSMWQADTAATLMHDAAAVVHVAAGGNFDRDAIRTQPFTEKVKQLALRK